MTKQHTKTAGPQSVLWALFSRKGRIRRRTYLFGIAFICTLWWFALAQVFSLPEGSNQHDTWLIVLGCTVIASGYCFFALSAKRIQDIGFNGHFAFAWILFATFMPTLAPLALFVLAFVPGDEQANSFGPPPVD